jgi:hypothetical protein
LSTEPSDLCAPDHVDHPEHSGADFQGDEDIKTSPAWFSSPSMTGVICAACTMVLYALTVAPTFSWGDSADLAMRLISDADQTFIGTHRDYVFFRLVGQAATWLPIQDAGLRANLFTAFWGAVTIGSVAFIVKVICRSAVAAFAAASSLAVAHSFWLLSVIAEVYTFNAALVFLAFAFMVAWWDSANHHLLWATAFFSGLSLLHHASGLVLLVSIIPLLAMRARQIGLLNGAVFLAVFVLSSSTFWLAVFSRFGEGFGLLDTLGLKMSQNAFFEVSAPKELLKFLAYLSFNFVGIGLILGFAGLAQAVKNMAWAVLPPLIWAGAFIYAGVTSSIPDKFNVYVLVYPSFAIFVGLGAAWVVQHFALQVRGYAVILGLLVLLPLVGYATTVWASRVFNVDLVGARTAPFRNNATYFLWPPKTGDYGPRTFAELALMDLPKDAILIADYTLWRPIYFVQAVESIRTDVEVMFVERLFYEGVDKWISRQSCKRRVFLATINPPQYYQLDKIEARFDISQFRSIYEVERDCQ